MYPPKAGAHPHQHAHVRVQHLVYSLTSDVNGQASVAAAFSSLCAFSPPLLPSSLPLSPPSSVDLALCVTKLNTQRSHQQVELDLNLTSDHASDGGSGVAGLGR